MFAQVPLIKLLFGMRQCMGFVVSSFEADENTNRRLEFEMSVIASSNVNGWLG